MVELPCATVVANPPELIVAAAGLPGVHVASEARSLVGAWDRVAVAGNGCVLPAATLGAAGVTARAVTTAGSTVMSEWPLMAPTDAVTVAVPCALPGARALVSTGAMEGADDRQGGGGVRVCGGVSGEVPGAGSC